MKKKFGNVKTGLTEICGLSDDINAIFSHLLGGGKNDYFSHISLSERGDIKTLIEWVYDLKSRHENEVLHGNFEQEEDEIISEESLPSLLVGEDDSVAIKCYNTTFMVVRVREERALIYYVDQPTSENPTDWEEVESMPEPKIQYGNIDLYLKHGDPWFLTKAGMKLFIEQVTGKKLEEIPIYNDKSSLHVSVQFPSFNENREWDPKTAEFPCFCRTVSKSGSPASRYHTELIQLYLDGKERIEVQPIHKNIAFDKERYTEVKIGERVVKTGPKGFTIYSENYGDTGLHVYDLSEGWGIEELKEEESIQPEGTPIAARY